MKTVFKKKLRDIKKVLSKSNRLLEVDVESFSSITTLTMSDENESIVNEVAEEDHNSKSETLSQEIQCLKEQVASLKNAVEAHQSETEQKSVALAEMAREKDRIAHELRRQKSINTHLINQLEDERRHYYEAKQTYCQEMAELKRLQTVISNCSNVRYVEENERIIKELREQVTRLKSTLSQTMEANYNLSVKFLRMKNSKTCIKSELQKLRLDHEKVLNVVKSKMCDLKDEINYLIDQRMVGDREITSSSKKYLQIVKQNSCLVYENLCQQLEMDQLNARLDKIKMQYSKQAAKNKLKYSSSLRSDDANRDHVFCSTSVSTKATSDKTFCEKPEKLEKPTIDQSVINKKSKSACCSSKCSMRNATSSTTAAEGNAELETEIMCNFSGIT